MTVDGADVFLETLAQVAERDRLRVKTRRNGRVFVNPVFRFRTYPVGVGDLARWVRTRRHGPQNDLVRGEIVPVLNGLLIRTVQPFDGGDSGSA